MHTNCDTIHSVLTLGLDQALWIYKMYPKTERNEQKVVLNTNGFVNVGNYS